MQQRVGYVVKRYPRYSETFIVNEILAHEASGLEIEIFALRPPNDTHFQDQIARVRAPVHYLPHAKPKSDEFWRDLASARRDLPGFDLGLERAWGCDATDVHQAVLLASHARDLGLAHLHAHFATSPAIVARIAAGFARVPFTFTAHAKDIFHDDVDAAELRERQRSAAAVITVSDFNEKYLKAGDPSSSDRIVRIYNGLNLEEFSFSTPRERPKRIIAVGRLVEKKGFTYLLDACAVLARSGSAFDCVIVGTGPLEDDLRRRISELGLEGSVELVGPQPQGVVRNMLRGAAVMVAPCIVGADGNRDGLPTTLLEAMALGTPCISTDVTGIPEILHHEQTGLLVAQRDPAGLAKAIHNLLTSAQSRVRMARAARSLIESHFDVTKNAARQREVFAASIRDAVVAQREVA
jgi:glycosyltransferase involved in cell wall biosynthesis